jgi:beta-xylosidase
MAHSYSYPLGRIPMLAPITWGSDGFPTVQVGYSCSLPSRLVLRTTQLVNGRWGNSYTDPATAHPVSSSTGVDYFTGSALGPRWEWNHNPDTTKFSLGSTGLVLRTTTVTTDLYSARNTLARRTLGPISTATIKLDYTAMHDGDRAGLAMFRDQSAWIGVMRDNGAYKVAMVTGINMDTTWTTTSTGTTAASASISGGTIYLRATANVGPTTSKQATFSYSTNGSTFTSLGSALTMNTDWHFFLAYRFAIFNYATSALGGQVTVPFFQLDAGSGSPPPTSGVTSTTTRTTTTTGSSPTAWCVFLTETRLLHLSSSL